MVVNLVVRRFVRSGVDAAFKIGGSKFGGKSADATQTAAPVGDPAVDAPMTQRPITDAEREAQLAGKDIGVRAKKTAKLGRRMGRF